MHVQCWAERRSSGGQLLEGAVMCICLAGAERRSSLPVQHKLFSCIHSGSSEQAAAAAKQLDRPVW